jgi:hypothetical protein
LAKATKTDSKVDFVFIPSHFEDKTIPGSVTLTLTLEEAGALRTLTGNVASAKYETDVPRKLCDEVWGALASAGVSAVGTLARTPMFK